ncbi:MAG: phage prohead protease [Herbinix sp.]|jgi:HK97 family phage prohead protease|nr:phage prohead protease [Herbinix sp.]
MNVEIRADGLHITGYVNVPGRKSRPVIVNGQKMIEVIEQRAFERAIERSGNIPMTLDHNDARVLAQTGSNNLELREDQIGLRADTTITDPEVIQGAKNGKLKGWSFGMKKVTDDIEERAGQLPIRHVKDFILDHVTIVMNKVPCYAATSIELRADTEDPEEIETRSEDTEVTISGMEEETKKDPEEDNKVTLSYSVYEMRIKELQVGL